MDLSSALIIYVIATILLFLFFYNILRIRGWSSFILAIIAGLIILWCLYPLTAETLATAVIKNDNLVMAYGIIWFLTAILAFIYLVIKAFSDKRLPPISIANPTVLEITPITQ